MDDIYNLKRFDFFGRNEDGCCAHLSVFPIVDDNGVIFDPRSILPKEFYEDRDYYYDYIYKELMDYWAAPRLSDIALPYLKRLKTKKNIAIYPLGDLSKRLIDSFSKEELSVVKFILDKDSDKIQSWKGIDVLSPDVLSTNANLLDEIEEILVLHPTREALLKQNLSDLGVKNKKIYSVFSDLDFIDWWRDNKEDFYFLFDRFYEECSCFSTNVEHLIVTSNPGLSIIQEKELMKVFPVENTCVMYIGNPNFFLTMKSSYRRFNLYCSLDLLSEYIDYLKPRTIHVVSQHADNYLGLLMKKRFKDILMTHEIYDWSLIFSNHYVEPIHSVSSALMDASRVGEVYSLEEFPILISKREGNRWRDLMSSFYFKAKYLSFFHNYTSFSDESGYAVKVVPKIVYAGPLPPENFPEGWPVYEISNLLRVLSLDDRVDVDIYNSLHPDSGEDSLFDKEILFYGDRYHRCLPLKELLPILSSYDYGWICSNKKEYWNRNPDTAFTFSARMISYINSGIPVIIDTTWDVSVNLVRKFDAGIVVDLDTLSESEVVSFIIREFDPLKHRNGVEKMKKYMGETNSLVLDSLRDFHSL